jgi:hypothetical protein
VKRAGAVFVTILVSCGGIEGGATGPQPASTVVSTARSTTTSTSTTSTSTTSTSPTTSSTSVVTTTVPVTTLPLSPLAVQLGAAESVAPRPVTAAPAPVRLVSDDIGVDHPVRAVGLQPDGQLEIPDESEVGWYRLGSAPGEPGAIVIAGHVSWNGADGPFLELDRLEPGALVRVELADGSRRDYSVVEHARYPKLMLPAKRIWTRTGAETLVLITCGGEFNSELRRYYDNVVVYAVPTG